MSKLYRFPLRYTKEDESHRRQEKGRTMLEMMSVLVIVGILSLLGLTAYTIAMKTYRVNESVNEIRTAASSIKSGNFQLLQKRLCDEDGVCSGEGFDDAEVVLNPSSYISGVENIEINTSEGKKDGWKTTYNQSIYAVQRSEDGKESVEMHLFFTPAGESENKLSVDECTSFVNPNVGYDYIAVNGSKKCSNAQVRNKEEGCTMTDLCPPEAE